MYIYIYTYKEEASGNNNWSQIKPRNEFVVLCELSMENFVKKIASLLFVTLVVALSILYEKGHMLGGCNDITILPN